MTPAAMKQRPHDDGSADSPQQNAVLLMRGSSPKRAKHDQEDEEIVDAQRGLDQVAGEELQRMLMSVDAESQSAKPQARQTRKSVQPQASRRAIFSSL